MRVTISPDKMSVLASNASTAFHLLALGVSDSGVASGLSQATRFCDVLSDGNRIREARSHRFSAEGLAKKDFLDLICELPDGDRLTAEFPHVKETLEALQASILSKEVIGNVPTAVRRDARMLARYFFDFANRLAIFEAARARLNSGRNARG
jgi:hypothetical protein